MCFVGSYGPCAIPAVEVDVISENNRLKSDSPEIANCMGVRRLVVTHDTRQERALEHQSFLFVLCVQAEEVRYQHREGRIL